MRRILLLAFFLLSALTSALAQATTPQTGVYEFGAYDTPGIDTINRGNLNVHLSIPIFSKPGRAGSNFTFALSYDSIVWTPTTISGGGAWQPAANWGWSTLSNAEFGYVSYHETISLCTPTGSKIADGTITNWSQFVYHDKYGKSHAYAYSAESGCATSYTPPTASGIYPITTDNSGYTVYQNGLGSTVFTKSGEQYSVNDVASFNGNSSSLQGLTAVYTDTNGNTISASSSGAYTDTLNKTVLTVSGSGTASSPTVYSYSEVGGTTNATVTVNYTNYNIATAFATNSTTEYSATSVPLISSIVYSGDNSKYTFTYEATPGQTGYVTGRIASITLRTGGTISYAYTGSSRNIEYDGSPTALERTTSDGSTTYVRSGESATTSTTTYTDALSNQAVSNFLEDTNGYIYEVSRSAYAGSATGTPLLSVATCYVSSCGTNSVTAPIQYQNTTIQQNGITVRTDNQTYSAGFLIDDNDGYWDTATPIQSFTGPNSIDFYRPASSTTKDLTASGSPQIAATTYTYDTPALTTNPVRGNLTNISPWSNSTNATFGETTIAYDTNGSPQTGTLSNPGLSTTFKTTLSYDSTDSYVTGVAYPTPSSGVALSTGSTYDPYTGLIITSVDMNGNTTTYKTYDAMLRLTEVDYPDGGKQTADYISPNQVNVGTYLTSSTYETTATLTDGYGRTSRVAIANGQSSSGYYQQDTCYDADGRVEFVSYKYSGTGFNQAKVCSGAGDTYSYDALGRVTKIAHSDGTAVNYTYNGHATKVTDEKGVSRVSQVDGHGRVTGICEVSSTTYESVAPSSCGFPDMAATGFLTSYVYTTTTVTPPLGSEVTTVTQGSQTRVFKTDSLGRTILVQEPEATGGATSYTYALNATGLQTTRVKPQANQTGSTTTTTTTQYDSMGRVTGVTYSDGTPTKTFYYDVLSNWAAADLQTNLKGNLSYHTRVTGAGQANGMFGYDKMNRVVLNYTCVPSGCGNTAYDHPVSYVYNLAGMLTSEGDGAGDTYTYGRSLAGEITGLTSSYSNSTSPANVIVPGSVQNTANGPTLYTMGNGLNQVSQYDSLGRNTGGFVCNGSTAASCQGGTQNYGYLVGWTGAYANSECDTVLNICQTFSFDSLGRLAGNAITQGSGSNYSFTYDRYGNRWQQSGGSSTYSASYSATTNQMTEAGVTYDAAGNMTKDPNGSAPQNSYTYDADGNLIEVANASYTTTYYYDSFNNRVRVSGAARGTYEFTFDIAGRRLSTWGLNATTPAQVFTYGDSKLALAMRDTSTHFEHYNWVGTKRVTTSYGGSVEGTISSLPFGDGEIVTGSNPDWSDYAELDGDTESNTEHAQFRQYSQNQGRWLTMDPYLGSYDFSNPQSFNRYAYALNNPVSLIDPLGLDDSDCANNPNCGMPGVGGGGGGGGAGCQPSDSSCSGAGDPFFGPCCGILSTGLSQDIGQQANASLIAWLSSGSIPYYTVQGGDLMLLVADPMVYVLNPPGSDINGILMLDPVWFDLGTTSIASGAYSVFGAPFGNLAGGGGAPSNVKQFLTQPVPCGGGYGQPCTPTPPPTCKSMDTTGDVIGGTGAVGTIGFGAASLTTAGAASPATVPGLTGSGIAWAFGNLLNILAKHGVGCTGGV